MDCALHLLEQIPAEQLHYNLDYIAQNMQRDFVAETLKPEGRTLARTVEQLYEKKKNFDMQKVKDITDFVNGFEESERITDENINRLLNYNCVDNARFRYSLSNSIRALFGMGTSLGSLGGGAYAGVLITKYLENMGYISQTNIFVPGILCTMIIMTGVVLGIKLSFLASDMIDGDQKPTEAYNFLHYKASLADKYIELYNIMEEKNFLK